MAGGEVTVLGGGVAGLSSALLLARQGHPVVLLERDRFAPSTALDAPTWERRGIHHFLQPHALIPRARLELRTHLPDVYAALLEAGGTEVDGRKKMPGPSSPVDDDEQLQYLAVRRPLLEWALRRAVEDEDIDVRDGVTIDGLHLDGGRMTGVGVDGGTHPATVVVDALGRRTPTQGWLAEAGIATTPVETSDCGVVYYSRYYRTVDGFDLPDGPWVLSPRGDLGYLGFATFPGDNGTFAGLLSVPNGGPEWRALSDESAFEAAVASIPGLRLWVDPDGVEPITGVMPMAGLANSFRHAGTAAAAGLAPVGDAHGHTDPVLAHGLAFALAQAAALAAALADHAADPIAGLGRYVEAVTPALRERFELSSALDDQRHRMWTGEAVDVARGDGGAAALWSVVAGGAASMMDPDVFRMFMRRMGLLDSTSVLDDDPAMQARIEELFAQAMQTPRPPSGPSRDEMVAIITAARGS
jgi:2-polyprenyl-6-methoxyphenol hydroxylase-like FAD-dependent oxidoreductase